MITKSKSWADYLLWLLLAIGLFGVAKVSYENFTGSPCPHVLSIPICYLVLVGYALMAMAVGIWRGKFRQYSFAIGWAVAASIALVGSIAEFSTGGGVCPTSGGGALRGSGGASSGGIPLCYISLAMLVLILLFFILGPYKRSCDACNLPNATA